MCDCLRLSTHPPLSSRSDLSPHKRFIASSPKLGFLNSTEFATLRHKKGSKCVSEGSADFEPEKRKPRPFDENQSEDEKTDVEIELGVSSSPVDDFLELKRELESMGSLDGGEDVLVGAAKAGRAVDELGAGEVGGRRKRRQVMRRSSLVAKQVISVRSACSLGFVSQLWVNANLWMVAVVEVRPSLLSGEMERFLLEDVSQVGDVVLVPDEGVMDNELKLVGLDTLEGYDVVTSSRRKVGKVRGYNFNINTGAVESLELDSFGSSLIPTSLVSTYCLFVEDVLEVVADTVIVHEGASSRVQRITKGFWDAQKAETPQDRFTEYPKYTNRGERSIHGRNNRSSRNQRTPLRRRNFEDEDDWELPMDY